MRRNKYSACNLWLLMTCILFSYFSVKGQQNQSLSEGQILYLNPKWSPKGTSIAFTSNCEDKFVIYTISSNGKDLFRETDTSNDCGIPNWSPDGNYLIYHKILGSNLLKLFTKSLKLQTEKQITMSNSIDYSPSWSSKNSIVFNSRTSIDDLNHHLTILFLKENKQQIISDTKFDYSGPCILKNGEKIVCIKTTAMTKPFKETTPDELKSIRKSSEIILMNADGTNIRNMTNDTLINRSPSFSDNGENIYYLTQLDSISIVKKYSLASSKEETIISLPGVVNSFSVSPDEKYIVYSSKKNGYSGIYILNIENKTEKLLIGK